jgi:adenylate kinase family enzyme
MVVKVFVFGCPGSGKSTASSYIEMIVRDKGDKWSTFRINDYKILDGWFQDDTEEKRFRPSEYGGFDITIPKVYDEALDALKEEVLQHQPSRMIELIVIEFARCDYQHALEQLGKEFRKEAYFLFLDADIETCVQRIHERVQHPNTLDDHFVSNKVIECYDRPNYVETNIFLLKTTFEIDDARVRIIDNSKNCNERDFYNRVKDFVNYIADRNGILPQVTDLDPASLSIQLEGPDTKPLVRTDEFEFAVL